jgi:hypothetical protein
MLKTEQHEQLKTMLLDLAENIEPPSDFRGSRQAFKHEWLLAVSKEAANLARGGK